MATDKDDLPKHLEFILDVVERHARNSVVLKGWSVTLVAAVFLLAVRGAEPALAMAAGLLPSLTFWALDAYYLRQERMFRALYNHVRKAEQNPAERFSLDARPFASEVPGWIRTLGATPVNVVRNSDQITRRYTKAARFHDKSLWEEAKKQGPLAIKRMINGGLDGSSVTCVLIGSQTWRRPWALLPPGWVSSR